MLSALLSFVPDAYTGDDGVIRIKFEIEASQLENVFLAGQLLLEDMFPQTASLGALRLHGNQYEINFQPGLPATGALQFSGGAGQYLPLQTEAAYDPGEGFQPIFFITTQDGSIPDPGVPTPPTAAVGAAGALTGLYEYVVTYVTAAGETLASIDSNAVTVSAQNVNLTAIPVGGPGTLARRIYRQKNGTDAYRRVTEIADNTTLVYTDSNSDASIAANPEPPAVDTAHAIILSAQARVPGSGGNVAAGTVRTVTTAPIGTLAVTNPNPFVGGEDEEDTESFRERLLDRIRNPLTGAPDDLKAMAENVFGVEAAVVYQNDNMGVATPGHATVRISGSGGAIPDAATVDAVFAAISEIGFANITLHVGTFTPIPTNITVDVELDGTYTLAEVTPGVQEAITEYINSLPVGATLRVSAIVDAVYGLAGVVDVVVTTPATNQTTAADAKRTPGVITVT